MVFGRIKILEWNRESGDPPEEGETIVNKFDEKHEVLKVDGDTVYLEDLSYEKGDIFLSTRDIDLDEINELSIVTEDELRETFDIDEDVGWKTLWDKIEEKADELHAFATRPENKDTEAYNWDFIISDKTGYIVYTGN